MHGKSQDFPSKMHSNDQKWVKCIACLAIFDYNACMHNACMHNACMHNACLGKIPKLHTMSEPWTCCNRLKLGDWWRPLKSEVSVRVLVHLQKLNFIGSPNKSVLFFAAALSFPVTNSPVVVELTVFVQSLYEIRKGFFACISNLHHHRNILPVKNV